MNSTLQALCQGDIITIGAISCFSLHLDIVGGGYKERLHLGIHFLRFEAQNDAVKCIKVEIAFY